MFRSRKGFNSSSEIALKFGVNEYNISKLAYKIALVIFWGEGESGRGWNFI